MATQTDFWGEIAPSAVRTPVAILREQGTLLGQKTKHVIEARVSTEVCGQSFVHAFDLVMPALENFTYQLFKISTGVSPYPVTVRDGNWPSFETEQEFTE